VVERNIHDRFIAPHELVWTNANESHEGITGIFRKARDFAFNSNSEDLYTVLLQGSNLTSRIYSEIATIKFDLFGYISDKTPVYSLDQFSVPVLFYKQTVNDQPTSFYFNHTDDLIKTYVDNIADLSEKLLKYYNLKLILVPVPNKFTIYVKKIRPFDKYDNFLPRLHRELDARGIKNVNLYDDYISSDTLLYYGTDSHWNKKGVDIAVQKILEEIRHENSGNLDQSKP
jgi:hypothetical protein